MKEILDQISQSMPPKCYIHTLKYKSQDKRIFFKKIFSKNITLKPEERKNMKFAQLIEDQSQEIDVKKSLKIVKKRLTFHTIQLKTGKARTNYLVKSGVVQG